MQSHIYDVIVIGAGGMGSASAYHIAKTNADVLVLEQFQHGHKFGSSHGETRIIRFFYDKPYYVELMKTAYSEWRKLESASKKQLLFTTGSVNLGANLSENGNPYLQSIKKRLDAAGVACEWWEQTQLSERFPQFNASDDINILWQKDTGFLYASECVLTHLQSAEQHGATVLENTRANHIDWQKGFPIVYTKGKQFQGRKIVLTAGAWTSDLLKELNLTLSVTKQQVCYYRPTDTALFQPNQFPVFTEITKRGEFLYGIPCFGKNGVKVARHGSDTNVLPDTCDRTPDADYIQRIDGYVTERLPSLGKTVSAEVCLYTETPDEDFIIDTHPECHNLLIAAGFSGHGFKFCSLVGRIMSELVSREETDFDISPFRINR